MTIEWWHWVAGGLILSLLELVIPSFTILWFGLGGILVGLILVFLPNISLSVQLVLWLLFSCSFVWVWFKYVKPKGDRTRSGLSKEAVVGQIGMAIEAGGPYQNGKVRFQVSLLGDDTWTYVSDQGIERGDRVRVIDVEGQMLRVEKVD